MGDRIVLWHGGDLMQINVARKNAATGLCKGEGVRDFERRAVPRATGRPKLRMNYLPGLRLAGLPARVFEAGGASRTRCA
jgi:hypothetical protein